MQQNTLKGIKADKSLAENLEKKIGVLAIPLPRNRNDKREVQTKYEHFRPFYRILHTTDNKIIQQDHVRRRNFHFLEGNQRLLGLQRLKGLLIKGPHYRDRLCCRGPSLSVGGLENLFTREHPS